MSLATHLLGIELAPGLRGAAEFDACVAASNGMLIPQELVVQARLADCAGAAQARLLRREFEHKRRLIDGDRRVAVCVCDIQPRAPQASAGLADCIAALAPREVPRVLVFPLSASRSVARVLTARAAVSELVALVNADLPANAAADQLAALAERPRAPLVAVLRGAAAADGGRALTRVLLAQVDVLFLLPMLHGERNEAGARRARFSALADEAAAAGMTRLAPGLYGGPAQRRPWLHRLTARLPQSDLLGLGPAASSRFNDVNFDNHPAQRDYAQDIVRGGFAIARARTHTPQEKLVEALLFGLASGATVDVHALAQRCQCASPAVLAACEHAFDLLRERGAVSGSPRLVELESANDPHFAEVCAEVARLGEPRPAVTLLARR